MYRRGDLTQAARKLTVLNELRGFPRGRRLSAIADALKVSEKTVKRDLADLESAGFEIDRSPMQGRAAARLIDKAYSHVPITRRERYTLFAMRAMAGVLTGTQFHSDYERILAKLEQRLTPELRDEYQTFGDRFVYVPHGGTKLYDEGIDELHDDAAPDESAVNDLLNVLLGGVLDRKLMRFVYLDGRNRKQQGYLAAYAMLLYRNGLYVVGLRLASPQAASELATLSDTEANRVGLYAAERFEDATQLSTQFRPPPGFQLTQHISGFGIHDIGARGPEQPVVVEFSKDRAKYASSRRWHREQVLHELHDGRVRIKFPCRNLAPIVSWVLEWGPHARAVEPAALVDSVIRELEEARALYR